MRPRAAGLFDCHVRDAATADASGVTVPDAVKAALAVGYSARACAEDLVGLFTEPPRPRRRLRDLAASWHAEILARHPTARVTRDSTRGRAAQYARFHSRMSHHRLRRDLLREAAGDPVRAAQALLDILAARYAAQPGGGWRQDKLARALADVAGGPGLDIPFAPPVEGGQSAGSGHLALRYAVARALPSVRVVYAPLGRARSETRWSPYPADDIDIRRLRRWGEAGDVISDDLLMTDAAWYRACATRSLRVVEHRERVPAPPRRIELLMDVSGSMCGGDRPAHVYAIAAAIALLEHQTRGVVAVTLRMFDGAPHAPIVGDPAAIVAALLRHPWSGGGTSIDAALRAVGAEAEEVILITDGEDRVHAHSRVPLTTYHCLRRDVADHAALRARGAYHRVLTDA